MHFLFCISPLLYSRLGCRMYNFHLFLRSNLKNWVTRTGTLKTGCRLTQCFDTDVNISSYLNSRPPQHLHRSKNAILMMCSFSTQSLWRAVKVENICWLLNCQRAAVLSGRRQFTKLSLQLLWPVFCNVYSVVKHLYSLHTSQLQWAISLLYLLIWKIYECTTLLIFVLFMSLHHLGPQWATPLSCFAMFTLLLRTV